MPRTRTFRPHLLNALPNAFWTLLCVGPVYVFCMRYMGTRWLYLAGGASLLPMLLPRAALRHLSISRKPQRYRMLRVHWLIPLTQGSGWMRRLLGDAPLSIPRGRPAMEKLIRDTWVRERFHLALLFFFLLCAATALLRQRLAWFACLMLLNTLYNLYPIWLQQFLRMRFLRLLR